MIQILFVMNKMDDSKYKFIYQKIFINKKKHTNKKNQNQNKFDKNSRFITTKIEECTTSLFN